MEHLKSKFGEQWIKSYQYTDPLIAFDYDGTLTPIVAKPDAAELHPHVRERLRLLAQKYKVAIISGRARSDLMNRVGLENVIYLGNHGFESEKMNAHQMEIQNQAKFWNLQAVALTERLNDPGVEVEDKIYSIAIHYRKADSRKKVKEAFLKEIPDWNPLPRIIEGKCVLNLVPEEGPHKGVALLRLLKDLNKRAAVYFGDDDTDEDVFSLNQDGLLGIRVGRRRATAASYYVDTPKEVFEVMGWLLQDQES